MRNFKVPNKQLILIAKKHGLEELSLFGSVITKDFRKDSDVDVLIEFLPDANASLFDVVDIKYELESVFKRKVDVVVKSGLRNPFRRRAILENHEVIYAA